MPAILHLEAYERAAGHAPDVALFETWDQLAKALDERTAEQRCDAVFADRRLQQNCASPPALLQICNLLLGEGTLPPM